MPSRTNLTRTRRFRSAALVSLFIAVLAPLLTALSLLPAPLGELKPRDVLADSSYTPDNAIVDITAVALDDEPDSNPCSSGYKWIDTDLNKWAGGDWVYFCYKEGTLDDAITDIKAIFNSTSCGAGWTRVGTDLNAGTGDAPIYLCHRKDQGLPIIQLDVVTGITDLVPCSWVDGDWTRVQQDLNHDAGGLFIYLCYMDLAGVNGIDGCGNEGEAPCGPFTKFVWENGSGNCDRGLRQDGGECVNGLGDHARYQDTPADFQESWAYWAMQNQRQQLAWNEPLSSVMMLGAHNAYNNRADGYLAPNHTYSITDQLRSGARYVELDVHGGKPHLNGTQPQLCHSGAKTHLGCVIGDRQLYNAIKEIRNWLVKSENLDEVIVIAIYDLFYQLDGETRDQDSIDQTIAALDVYLNRDSRIGVFSADDFAANGNAFPSQAELVARGKRVILWSTDANMNPLIIHNDQWPNGLNRLPTEIEQGFWDNATCSASDSSEFDPSFPEFRTVYENNVPLVGGAIDQFNPTQVARLAECNVTILNFDGILATSDVPGDRLKAMVWSWAEGHSPPDGSAAYFDTSIDRWYSADPALEHHYACYIEDGDFGAANNLLTTDGDRIRWRATTATGPWDEGAAACQAAYPGSVYGVPHNGYENLELTFATTSQNIVGNVWLSYHDRDGDGWWTIAPAGSLGGPDEVQEGSLVRFEYQFLDPLEITEVTCGDNGGFPTPDGFGEPRDIGEPLPTLPFATVGDVVKRGEFACFFRNGPAASTVMVSARDAVSGEEAISLSVDVTVHNQAPRIPRPADVTIQEGDPVPTNSWIHVSDRGYGISSSPDETEGFSGTVDWGTDTDSLILDFVSIPIWPELSSPPSGIAGVLSLPPYTYPAPGSYVVQVEVCDVDGGCTTGSFTVTVENVDPVVSAPDDAAIDEGDAFTGEATFTTPTPGDTYEALINYGDGGPPVAVDDAVNPIELSHTYTDNGVFIIEVIVCDDDGGCGTDTTAVKVGNLPPQIDPLSDITVNEGDEFQTTVTFSDSGAADTHGWGVDFGDGTTRLPITDLTRTEKSFDVVHTYADDGIYTVGVGVVDDDIVDANPVETSLDTESFTVTVLNVAPAITDLPAERTVNEGEFFAETVFVSDPGVEDVLTYEINYGDGTPTPGPIALGDGIIGVDVQHTYADNGVYSLSITFCDDDGGCSTGTMVVTVENVAAAFDLGAGETIDEGGTFSRDASFGDPGADIWTATVDYSFGEQALALNSDKSFSLSHLYGDNGTPAVTVCIYDGDDETCDSLIVTVNNVAPSVDAPVTNPSASNEGDEVLLSAVFSDPGTDDSPFACRIDWGDGATTDGTVNGLTCEGTHTYVDNGPSGTSSGVYAIDVTVTDKDGGVGANAAGQRVDNVAPTIDEIIVPAVSAYGHGVPVSIGASDPGGINDPLSYLFDCNGNGTFERSTGSSNATTCLPDMTSVAPLIGVEVRDDDLGIVTNWITLSVEKTFCASRFTGELTNGDAGCQPTQRAVVLSPTRSATFCVDSFTGRLSHRPAGCNGSSVGYLVPAAQALTICENRSTGLLRMPRPGAGCLTSESALLIPSR